MKYPTRLSDAVHILAFIALYPDCDLTSNKLAESVQTNPAYVRQLMSALRKGGLLVSVKGHPRPCLLYTSGTWLNDDTIGVFACPDGIRPVIFLLEAE